MADYPTDFGEAESPLVRELNRLEDERFFREEREHFDRQSRQRDCPKPYRVWWDEDDTQRPCSHESGWCDCATQNNPPRGLDSLLVPTLTQRRPLSTRLDSWTDTVRPAETCAFPNCGQVEHGLNSHHFGPHHHAEHTPHFWCHAFVPPHLPLPSARDQADSEAAPETSYAPAKSIYARAEPEEATRTNKVHHEN